MSKQIETVASLLPFNAVTGRPYSGGNSLALLETGYDANAWAGFKQWKKVGRAVKRGETATRIKLVCEKKNKKTGKKEKVCRTLCVFNLAQTEEIK